MKKRLTALFSVIPQCDSLADVGCDHGYIGAEALTTGIAKIVYFCDISKESLDKARKLCESKDLFEADFFCGYGLSNIETEVAVIAGMGGMEIIDIVNKAFYLPEILILQPMKNTEDVRRALSDRYRFERDFVVAEGHRFYTIMRLRRGSDSFTSLELKFGRTNLEERSEDFVHFVQKEKRTCEEILKNTDEAESIKEYYKLLSAMGI